MKALFARLRRSPNWVLVIMVLILASLAVVAAVLLDNHVPWFGSHPITGNIVAGILGLPAAFLIIDIVAERAVAWSREAEWTDIRESEAASVAAGVSEACDLLQDVYRLGNSPEYVQEALYWREYARLHFELMYYASGGGVEPEPGIQPRNTGDVLASLVKLRQDIDEMLDDSLLTMSIRDLHDRSLPRLEAHASDPTLVRLVREGADALVAFLQTQSMLRGKQTAIDKIIAKGAIDLSSGVNTNYLLEAKAELMWPRLAASQACTAAHTLWRLGSYLETRG